MSAARHMIALLKSHLEGDDKEVLSVAMQAAAHEARLGHIAIAQQLRDLIDESKRRSSAVGSRPGQLVVIEPPGLGKTMTASALAVELHLPLLTIMLEGLIKKFMGETAAKPCLVFEAIRQAHGVYLCRRT